MLAEMRTQVHVPDLANRSAGLLKRSVFSAASRPRRLGFLPFSAGKNGSPRISALPDRSFVPASRIRPARSTNLHVLAASSTGLLPGGQRQLRVALPALMLVVAANDVLDDMAVCDTITEAVGAGLSAVILTDPGSASAGQLFEAACKMKEVLRGRALVLVMDRIDIATAAAIDGVILSPNSEWLTSLRVLELHYWHQYCEIRL
jgi:hypothetical protein